MFQHGRLMMNLIGLVVIAFVAVYGVMRFFTTSRSGVISMPVIHYTEEETLAARGWLVREETVILRGSGPIVDVLPHEGERVAVGDTLAVYYEDAAARKVGEELLAVERQIARLNDTLSIQGSADAAHLDRAVAAASLDIATQMGEQGTGDITETVSFLRDALFRRAFAFGDAAPLEVAKTGLEEHRRTLMEVAPRGQTAYTARMTGYFSSVVDGYETLVNPQWLRSASPSELAGMKPAPAVGEVLGKLVLSHVWRLALPLPKQQAEMLSVGREYPVRLQTVSGDEIPMRVERIGAEEDGTRVVTLTCRTAMPQTIGLRHVRAEIVLRIHTGLRVPVEAIRVDEATGAYGVYCVVAMQAVFKPITEVYRAENYWLVQYNPGRTNSLLDGDEVVVAAIDLFDGKPLR